MNRDNIGVSWMPCLKQHQKQGREPGGSVFQPFLKMSVCHKLGHNFFFILLASRVEIASLPSYLSV